MRAQTLIDDYRAAVDGDLAAGPGGDEPYLLTLAAALDDEAAEAAHPVVRAVLRREARRARRLGLVTARDWFAARGGAR
jgi:hypothetical protein